MANIAELNLEEMEKAVGGKNEKGWEFDPIKRCPAGCTTYKIRPGDNFHDIAVRHGTDTAGLKKLNPNVTNPDLIVAGFWLIVPKI